MHYKSGHQNFQFLRTSFFSGLNRVIRAYVDVFHARNTPRMILDELAKIDFRRFSSSFVWIFGVSPDLGRKSWFSTEIRDDSSKFMMLHCNSQWFMMTHPWFMIIHRDSWSFIEIHDHHRDSWSFKEIHGHSSRFTIIHRDSRLSF